MSRVTSVEAVVFDMDGVLVDTEHLWDDVREELTGEWGGRYTPEAQQAMMGMSSREWSRYLHEVVGLREPPTSSTARSSGGCLPGTTSTSRSCQAPWRPSERLAGAGLPPRTGVVVEPRADRRRPAAARPDRAFEVTVSSEEVAHGKPAPDVYLEAARRLGVDPARCIAVEDSASGIRAAHAAGMRVIAYPNRHYPPEGVRL